MGNRIYGKNYADKYADGGGVGDVSPELSAVASDFPEQSSDPSAQPDAPQASNDEVRDMADKAEAAQAEIDSGHKKSLTMPSSSAQPSITISGRAGYSAAPLASMPAPDVSQSSMNAPPMPQPMAARANGGLIGGARHYGKKP